MLRRFISVVRARSAKHRDAFARMSDMPSLQGGIIRFELDSLLRAAFICMQPVEERDALATLFFETGNFCNSDGKRVTDRQMVELLGGWVSRVYDAGCAMAHLSYLHDDHPATDLRNLFGDKSNEVEEYLSCYHSRPIQGHLTAESIWPYLPNVFEKIFDNLEFYLEHIERGDPPI